MKLGCWPGPLRKSLSVLCRFATLSLFQYSECDLATLWEVPSVGLLCQAKVQRWTFFHEFYLKTLLDSFIHSFIHSWKRFIYIVRNTGLFCLVISSFKTSNTLSNTFCEIIIGCDFLPRSWPCITAWLPVKYSLPDYVSIFFSRWSTSKIW